MSYYRHGYSSFQEFQRESFRDGPDLGKEELELLRELELVDDSFDVRPRRRRRSRRWD